VERIRGHRAAHASELRLRILEAIALQTEGAAPDHIRAEAGTQVLGLDRADLQVTCLRQLLAHLHHGGEHELHLARGEHLRQVVAQPAPLGSVQEQEIPCQRIVFYIVEESAVGEAAKVTDHYLPDQLQVHDEQGLAEEGEVAAVALPPPEFPIDPQVDVRPVEFLAQSTHISAEEHGCLASHAPALPVGVVPA